MSKALNSLEKSFRVTAAELLAPLQADELKSWFEHPCTRSLMSTLNADLCVLMEQWKEGVYTDESADATVALNSKNIGICQAIEEILEYIETIVRGKEEYDDETTSSGT